MERAIKNIFLFSFLEYYCPAWPDVHYLRTIFHFHIFCLFSFFVFWLFSWLRQKGKSSPCYSIFFNLTKIFIYIANINEITQHSKNEDHSIRSHHFMGNRWINSGNSVRLYFWGLQNHCRW